MRLSEPDYQQVYQIECSACGTRYEAVESGICSLCGERVQVNYGHLCELQVIPQERGIWRYREILPISSRVPSVTMGEGQTPLVRSCAIGPQIGIREVYFKLESSNPTGSFKDRIASLMISRCRAEGVKTILSITSGNAGSALAAYATRAGIRSIILQIAEAPLSKELQLHAYGAVVIRLSGMTESPENPSKVFAKLAAIGKTQGWPVSVMSHFYDPINIEAYKTISFEICEDLDGGAPDQVYVPVGGGGLFSALWKGFNEFHRIGRIDRLPRVIPVQPAGAASVMAGFSAGKEHAVRIKPQSRVSGACSSYTADGTLIITALRQTGGHCSCPTDEETFGAQILLARTEGIFAEPAGALSVAGLIRDVNEKRIDRDCRVVCLITGSGFKDREAAERLFRPTTVPSIHVDELEKIPSIVSDNQRGQKQSG